MADLDTYMDKVIVFEAIKASDASHQVTRQPLQPTNAQIPSPTRRSSHKAADIKPSLDGASDENHTPLSHSAVRNRLTPHSGATSPLSTSDHAGGSVDMAGFDRYYADLHDRIQVSYPDYSDGTHILVF